MTDKAQWRRDVLIALILKNKTVTAMARELGVSRTWIYKCLNEYEENVGALAEWEKKINKYCGLEEKQ